MRTDYLTAYWQNLLMVNYSVDPKILATYVPARVELDFHDGICYVSLVGFWFHQTRLARIPVPFFGNFKRSI